MIPWYLGCLLLGFAEGTALCLTADALLVAAVFVTPWRWALFGFEALLGALCGLAIFHFLGQWHELAATRFVSRFPGRPARFLEAVRARYRPPSFGAGLRAALRLDPPAALALEAGAADRSLAETLLFAGGPLAARYLVIAFVAAQVRYHLVNPLEFRRPALLAAVALLALPLARAAWAEIRFRRAAPEEAS